MLRKRSVGMKTNLPSLRRHYPGQVLRVLSQPNPLLCQLLNAGKGVQHPGNLMLPGYLPGSDAKIGSFSFPMLVTLWIPYPSQESNPPKRPCNISKPLESFYKTFIMSRIFSVFFISLISFSAFSQKQVEDANAEVRKVSGFHGIKVSTGITVYLTQGSTEGVAVSANDVEYRNRIRTEVVNGVLKIYFDNDDWKVWKNFSNKKLRAYVSVVNLDQLDVSSGGTIDVDGRIKTAQLSIDASSGGTVKGTFDASSLSVDQSSGSVVSVSGSVTGSCKIEGSSGSVFRGYDLATDNCDAHTSSGAGIQITVNKELSVNASSGGYIHYKGNGLIRDVKTSSGGSVSRKS